MVRPALFPECYRIIKLRRTCDYGLVKKNGPPPDRLEATGWWAVVDPPGQVDRCVSVRFDRVMRTMRCARAASSSQTNPIR